MRESFHASYNQNQQVTRRVFTVSDRCLNDNSGSDNVMEMSRPFIRHIPAQRVIFLLHLTEMYLSES